MCAYNTVLDQVMTLPGSSAAAKGRRARLPRPIRWLFVACQPRMLVPVLLSMLFVINCYQPHPTGSPILNALLITALFGMLMMAIRLRGVSLACATACGAAGYLLALPTLSALGSQWSGASLPGSDLSFENSLAPSAPVLVGLSNIGSIATNAPIRMPTAAGCFFLLSVLVMAYLLRRSARRIQPIEVALTVIFGGLCLANEQMLVVWALVWPWVVAPHAAATLAASSVPRTANITAAAFRPSRQPRQGQR